MPHLFETTVQPDWIDYNGHMRDAYYGLVFSLAVDSFQDEIGFDAAYRTRTGCTIYLAEDHKFFLSEVKQGARLRIETRVLDCDAKRFHLHMQMYKGATLACVGEFMELHVNQHPKPHTAPMPDAILTQLQQRALSPEEATALPNRARALGLRK